MPHHLWSRRERISGGVGALPGAIGVIVRVLAESSSTITQLMDEIWPRIRKQIIGASAPPRRK